MSSSSESYPQTWSSDDPSDASSVYFFYNIVKKAREIQDTASSSRPHVKRDRGKALEALMSDYFSEDSLYDDEDFRATFRLPKRLFLEIVNRIQESGRPFFQEGYDARNKKSFSTLQKCLSAVQQLADGGPAAQLDKYFKMAGRTTRECLQHFCDAVIELYHGEFLRRPTAHDVAVLQIAHEELQCRGCSVVLIVPISSGKCVLLNYTGGTQVGRRS
jgi:hypothetical protein